MAPPDDEEWVGAWHRLVWTLQAVLLRAVEVPGMEHLRAVSDFRELVLLTLGSDDYVNRFATQWSRFEEANPLTARLLFAEIVGITDMAEGMLEQSTEEPEHPNRSLKKIAGALKTLLESLKDLLDKSGAALPVLGPLILMKELLEMAQGD